MKRTLTMTLLSLGLASAPLGAQIGYHGFDPKNMDTRVCPCADFFRFAQGAWEDRTVIPAEYASYGVGQEMEERSFALMKEILESAAGDTAAPKGSERQKVGDFFASGMDVDRIEREGIRPLAESFARIDGVRGPANLAAVLAALHRDGLEPAFDFGVGQDDRDPDRYIVQVSQGGLGLREREYYLKQDARSKEIRAQYLRHVARTFELAGEGAEAAKAHADLVLRLELRLARASMSMERLRDPKAVYHKMTFPGFARLAPGLDWKAYFQAIGVPARERCLLVRQPGFFRELGRMARELPADHWRAYLRWMLLCSTSECLNSALEQEDFDFYGRVLQGTPVQKPRWKRILAHTDAALGEALGKLYVERTFPPKAKEKVQEMVKHLVGALRARITRLDWMGEATKVQALAKLDALRVKIGYPDVWRDYSKLEISRGPFVQNVLAAGAFEFQRNLAHLGRPIDRDEWSMTPSTNNAEYSPTLNEMCFPAGGLQPPYFDLEADDAVNYGNTGGTIGHEMIHGFDDEGRHYDYRGNLRDWWTPKEAKAFEARTRLVVKQFDAFEPLPGMHINGRTTLGENLADLAGLQIAYDAFQLSRQGQPPAGPIDGFTPEQRFFLGAAEYWRSKIRDEALRDHLMTDVHAPAKYRVLGPLANMPEFYEAFGCKDGDAMVRACQGRPRIW